MRLDLHSLTREWEKTLFFLVLFGLLVYGILILLGFGERKLVFGGADPTPPSVNRLNPLTAWEFVSPTAALRPSHELADPFAFTPHFKPKEIRDPPKPPPPKPPVPQPPPPKVYTVVQYGGFMVTPTTQRKVAVVRNVSSRKTYFLGPEGSFDGFTVVKFDETSLEVKTPAGAVDVLPVGQPKSYERP